MSDNLPPGVSQAAIDAQANDPVFEEFVNWLATVPMPADFVDVRDYKVAWLVGCIQRLSMQISDVTEPRRQAYKDRLCAERNDIQAELNAVLTETET